MGNIDSMVVRQLQCSRRRLVKVAAGVVCWRWTRHVWAAAGGLFRVSDSGGDRATGYVMSNKIARREGKLVCTWLDVERQNRWAMVDAGSGEVVRAGTVGGKGVDNHCGAAITTDPDGTLHLLAGAHHGPFSHYQMKAGAMEWDLVEAAVGSGTYPSLVCDKKGTLHVTYRHETKGRDPQLHYCRRERGGKWSAARALVRGAVDEHSWLTNALEVGPEGRLHVVISNTLPVPGRTEARYYGASHLYSDDAGMSWRQFGDAAALTTPVAAGKLKRIEADGLAAERVEATYKLDRGPMHSYYHKMVLSNPVVDERGRPWVIVHNVMAGDATLYGYEKGWVGTPLGEAVRKALPGYPVRHCGQLSRHRDGSIEMVLMCAPLAEVGWGGKGTTLVRIIRSADGKLSPATLVTAAEAEVPNWMPSLERWCWHAPFDRPALLYTRGRNAGGYSSNKNSVKTEVWMSTSR